MNSRREPYIGMPIVLGEYDPFMCANPADRPQRPQPPQMPQPSRPPQPPMPPQRPEPSRPPQASMPPTGQEPPASQEPGIETCPQPPQMQPPQTMVVGMAYVPWQKWQQPYDYEKGFEVGTIFPDLNLPFSGYQGGMGK